MILRRSKSRAAKPSGAILVNGAFSAPGPRTYAVFGVARGGTTMVAGVMRGLGIFMGEDLNPGNQEDPVFRLGVNRSRARMRETIAARNAAHEVWGWKFPAAVKYLPELHDDLRAPRYICVFRDSVANARRGIGGAGLTDLERIGVHLERTAQNHRFLAECGAPSLSISYEKALSAPRAFVTELAAQLGVRPDFRAFDFEGFMKPAEYKDFSAYRRA